MDSPPPVMRGNDESVSKQSLVEQWLADAQAGSHSALGRVFESTRKYLLMMANRALDAELKGKVGASDLVQDTYVEAQRDFGRFTGTTEEELFGWLTAILANRLANNRRTYRGTEKRNLQRELSGDDCDAALAHIKDDALTPSAVVLARDEERRIRLALEELAVPHREVLILRTWQRESFAAIGAQRGCSADAARKLWTRAVRQLQLVLEHIP